VRDAVRAGALGFTVRFEGYRDKFYLDVRRLVTIGFGNLADPAALVQGLDFVLADGSPATYVEIAASWSAVKNDTTIDPEDGSADYGALPGNIVRATRESIERLCMRKFAQNELALTHWFPGIFSFCADAQLLLASMTWAMGAGAFAKWPHFTAAVNRGDWRATAQKHGVPTSCQMDETGQNDAFRRRNAANLVLAKNAAIVSECGMDPEVLHWPVALADAAA
jgi:GH24 family phage-related lysozyme (muramidase)